MTTTRTSVVPTRTRRITVLITVACALAAGPCTQGFFVDDSAHVPLALTTLVLVAVVGGAVLGSRFNLLDHMRADDARAGTVFAEARSIALDLLVASGVAVLASAVVTIPWPSRVDDQSAWLPPLVMGATVFVGGVGGYLVAVLVVLPAWVLIRLALPTVRRRDPSVFPPLFAGLFLAVVAFATALALANQGAPWQGEVHSAGHSMSSLLGTSGEAPALPWLLWVARGLALLVVGLLVVIAREGRRSRREHTARRSAPRQRAAAEGER